jgi:geranylgeranyl diphosphate synthase, type II
LEEYFSKYEKSVAAAQKVIAAAQAAVQNSLQTYVNRLTVDTRFKEVLSYALLPSGKMMRPVLALLTAHALTPYKNALLEENDFTELFAKNADVVIALELLHVSSLVHDDLPSIDNDMYRRGKLALHAKFTEGQAVLAGDFLISSAFKCIYKNSLPFRDKILLAAHLSDAFELLCEGQYLDILDMNSSANVVKKMINDLKTGALFGCTFVCGGVFAQSSEIRTAELYEIGKTFGELFQLIDDFADQVKDKSTHRVTDSKQKSLQEILMKKAGFFTMLKNFFGERTECTEPLFYFLEKFISFHVQEV